MTMKPLVLPMQLLPPPQRRRLVNTPPGAQLLAPLVRQPFLPIVLQLVIWRVRLLQVQTWRIRQRVRLQVRPVWRQRKLVLKRQLMLQVLQRPLALLRQPTPSPVRLQNLLSVLVILPPRTHTLGWPNRHLHWLLVTLQLLSLTRL
ncbi:hypothetical protein AMBR_LLDLPDMO_01824 [Lactiplantibacillus plantarum]|nr:hypothetical protein AMBR_LLDLPDMO_01824 [Lactiplantibacillus plantarum]